MSEDALDIENHAMLADYLRRREPSCDPTHFQTLAGGVSNRTVLVQFRDGQSWVIKQALAKLRTKADWFSDPSRVHREALGIRWLGKLAPPGTIPEFVFEDFENHLLAMQAVAEPHENWKEILMRDRFESKFEYFVQFGQLLGTIHRKSSALATELNSVFADATFFHSLRIEPYYFYTAERVPAAKDFIHELVEDSAGHRTSLVHGDFSPKNILVYEDRLILLDHEVIHWGDPAFDVGFALTHLLSKARNLRPQVQLMLGALKFWQAYQSVNQAWLDTDGGAETRIIRHTLACMLARVAGRSPLEYLNDAQKAAQLRDVLARMKTPVETVHLLIHALVVNLPRI